MPVKRKLNKKRTKVPRNVKINQKGSKRASQKKRGRSGRGRKSQLGGSNEEQKSFDEIMAFYEKYYKTDIEQIVTSYTENIGIIGKIPSSFTPNLEHEFFTELKLKTLDSDYLQACYYFFENPGGYFKDKSDVESMINFVLVVLHKSKSGIEAYITNAKNCLNKNKGCSNMDLQWGFTLNVDNILYPESLTVKKLDPNIRTAIYNKYIEYHHETLSRVRVKLIVEGILKPGNK